MKKVLIIIIAMISLNTFASKEEAAEAFCRNFCAKAQITLEDLEISGITNFGPEKGITKRNQWHVKFQTTDSVIGKQVQYTCLVIKKYEGDYELRKCETITTNYLGFTIPYRALMTLF